MYVKASSSRSHFLEISDADAAIKIKGTRRQNAKSDTALNIVWLGAWLPFENRVILSTNAAMIQSTAWAGFIIGYI